jgi:hypothetical protein
MSESHETILGTTSNGPTGRTRKEVAPPGIGEPWGEGWGDLSLDRGRGLVPRSYDWFGEVDPDGLSDGDDFPDGASAPSERPELP